MATFDYFGFMHGRRTSVPPTEEELHSFNLFMSQMVLSMNHSKSTVNILDKINTKEFFDLPNEIQCMAFTSLDGTNLDLSWKKTKVGSTDSVKELIGKVMKVYNISHNEAVSCVKYKTIDVDEVEDLYTRLFEPENIKFRAKPKSKSKSSKQEESID